MDIRFHDKFVFRTPAYPYNSTSQYVGSTETLKSDQRFLEAIYLASPVLYDQTVKWINGELVDTKEISKLKSSLYKYKSRMSTRSTPYGLFAHCGTGSWDQESKIIFPSRANRRTRLDMNFVCALANKFSQHKEVAPYLTYFPNSSIYSLGGKVRYIEYQYYGYSKVHKISSVDTDRYITKLLDLANNGATIPQLCQCLTEEDISEGESNTFIQEIIQAQLLVSELEPTVTGPEFIVQIVEIIDRIRKQNSSDELIQMGELLQQVNASLQSLDENECNSISAYRAVLEQLQNANLAVNERMLFQVDGFRNTIKSNLNIGLQNQIKKAITLLSRLTLPYRHAELQSFANRFTENYQDEEVSLLQALDSEVGIGYPHRDITGRNELIDDLQIPNLTQTEGSVRTNYSVDKFLLNKLIEANKHNLQSVVLSDEDLRVLPEREIQLPPTFNITFKVIAPSTNKIHLRSIGGLISATSLLGRFAHGDAVICSMSEDLAAFEDSAFPDKVVAELVHLPEDRIGNILLRPVFRNYEISCLAKSALHPDKQILPNDLLVSVKNNNIVLRSRKLNKTIIPRISTAHNYVRNAIPLYRFLGDLQSQNIDTPFLGFTWGIHAGNFKFLPRLEYGGIILFAATWQLDAEDFLDLVKSAETSKVTAVVASWKNKWSMPDLLLLKDSDNELLIDLNSTLSINAFIDTIKKRPAIELVEYLFNPEAALIQDDKNRVYSNEIIAPVYNQSFRDVSSQSIKHFQDDSLIKRQFVPGDEWLYYKIYCGAKTADNVIIELSNSLNELLRRTQIEKWFFIRYTDPSPHVRVRIKSLSPLHIGSIMNHMAAWCIKQLDGKAISKVLLDTYTREIERYGARNIEYCEEFFSADSEDVIDVLLYAQQTKIEELKWQYSLRFADAFLDTFQLTVDQKSGYVESMRDAFIKEHSSHKSFKVQLDKKYRRLKPLTAAAFENTDDNLNRILERRNRSSRIFAEKIRAVNRAEVSNAVIYNLIGSMIHMTMNRLFKSRQRTYELLLYDHLYRHYRTISAIKKGKSNNNC